MKLELAKSPHLISGSKSADRHSINIHTIFVYGTLRRNANNEMSRLLADHAEFVDEAVYCGKLFKVADYPGVIPSDDSRDVVKGDVYRLHQADLVLPLLDRYEECGAEFPEPNEYRRLRQTVHFKNGGSISAWVYVYNHPTDGLEPLWQTV